MSSYIDSNALDELRILMGDELKLLYETFLEDATAKVQQLEGVAAEQDFDKTGRLAHSLKGSSRNIGAFYLSDLCESLEKSAKIESSDNWKFLISDIKDSFERTAAEINHSILQ
ncbi:MAG: Hpt domain-containing protein [Gammaproteobacteria bacterium]|nr:Hpt domain-containing protein [Gammaproteobacteria bacterium]MDH5630046.1 Hpt domain-containing protein [Gammaproteobacteria bacterium]